MREERKQLYVGLINEVLGKAESEKRPISGEEMNYICQTLRKDVGIRELNLSNKYGMSDEAVQELSKFIAEDHKHFEKLDISWSKSTTGSSQQMQSISNAILRNNHLVEVNFRPPQKVLGIFHEKNRNIFKRFMDFIRDKLHENRKVKTLEESQTILLLNELVRAEPSHYTLLRESVKNEATRTYVALEDIEVVNFWDKAELAYAEYKKEGKTGPMPVEGFLLQVNRANPEQIIEHGLKQEDVENLSLREIIALEAILFEITARAYQDSGFAEANTELLGQMTGGPEDKKIGQDLAYIRDTSKTEMAGLLNFLSDRVREEGLDWSFDKDPFRLNDKLMNFLTENKQQLLEDYKELPEKRSGLGMS